MNRDKKCKPYTKHIRSAPVNWLLDNFKFCMRDMPDKADKVPARHTEQTARRHFYIERQADTPDLASVDKTATQNAVIH